MKRILLLISLLFLLLFGNSQNISVKYSAAQDKQDLMEFMSMVGFNNFSFVLKSPRSLFVNIYIDEYLNDSLISKYDLLATKNDFPKSMYSMIFAQTGTGKFPVKIYSLSRNDTTEEVQFRVGGLGLYKKLRVNKKDFSYEWKLSGIDNVYDKAILNQKFPLLYFSSELNENIDGKAVNMFCNIPNILNNRKILETSTKISHFFTIGLQLVERIE